MSDAERMPPENESGENGCADPDECPDWQLHEMPAGMIEDGSEMASLKDVLSSERKTRDFFQLELADRAKITVERLNHLKSFNFGTFGVGPLTLEQAKQEVMKQTATGLALIEIEGRMIKSLMKRAKKQVKGR